MKKKRLVAIFCGGPSSEHDVSIASAKNIFAHLDRKKYQPTLLYIDRSLNATWTSDSGLKLSALKGKKPLVDILRSKKSARRRFGIALLAALHGEFGEDGEVQGLLDYLKIPYTGSGMRASGLAMDKYRSALLVKHVPGVAIPHTQFIDSKEIPSLPFKFPVILKPNDLGSSVGVAIVRNKRSLNGEVQKLQKQFPGHPFLFQEYIHGVIEVSCGCLERRDGQFVPLPPIEITPKKDEFFTYKSKYEPGESEEVVPPRHIAGDVGAHISLLACTIHKLLGCRTYSRSDFLIKGKTIYYLETNTLPGMTATSLFPKEADAVGIPFPNLLNFIIENSQMN